VCREADTGSNKRGPASAKRGRPSSLPVGDEEEEGERGDDEVDKEDHEEPAHNISEMQFRSSFL